MTKAERYACNRQSLIEQMGGCCTYCKSTEKIQFHHPFGRLWQPNKAARWVRIARYRREWQSGLCVLACKKCNLAIGKPSGSMYVYVRGSYGKIVKLDKVTGQEVYSGNPVQSEFAY